MASAVSKESKTATSVAAVPTTSENATSPPPAAAPSTQLVHKISAIEQLTELLAGGVANPSRKVVLIEFYAEWCGPCKLIATKLEEWAKIYDVVIVKIDVDELEDLAIEYNVGGIPTFAFMKDKQKLEQLEGSQEEKILAALEKYCKKPDFGQKPQPTLDPNINKLQVTSQKSKANLNTTEGTQKNPES